MSASISPTGLSSAERSRRRRLWALGIVTLCLTHVALAAGASWWTLEHRDMAPSTVGARWRVIGVKDAAVTLRLGVDAASPVVDVPTGSALPNGEKVQATVPARSAYVTDSGTTIITQSKQ